MKIDIKTFTALKEYYLIDSIPATLESLETITKANTELIQSIYDSKPKLGEGEVFIETLSIKILLATKSILELQKGTRVSALTKDSNVSFLDFPSINIITRSIIEAYLTLEYLFYNDLSENEKEFRFYIWQISGYKARQNFFDKREKETLKESINYKLNSELLEIQKLLEKIEKYEFYTNLNKHSLWKLDKFGLPRLISWQKLLEQSTLRNSVFETSYKLYSNFAHSEFISLIQMNGKNTLNKDSIENNNALIISLRVVKMINCISIISLKNKFDFASKVFEKYDNEIKTMIQFWNEFAIEEK